MGNLYHYGYGVPVDYNEALRLYERANGTGTALNGIGILHQNGLGVPQSHSKAMEYFKLSADGDCADAFNSLDDVYYNGYGHIDRSYEEAFNWYTKSAEEQCDKGQFNLSLMHLEGKGMAIDYYLALYWMKKSAYNGSDEAHEYIDKINQKIMENSQNPVQSSGSNNTTDLIKLQEAEKAAKAAEEKVAILMAQLELQNHQIKSLSSHAQKPHQH